MPQAAAPAPAAAATNFGNGGGAPVNLNDMRTVGNQWDLLSEQQRNAALAALKQQGQQSGFADNPPF